MPRPKKVSGVARISGPPVFPRFPRGAWPKIEAAIGVKLSATSRKKIGAFARQYVEDRMIEKAGQKRARLLASEDRKGRIRAKDDTLFTLEQSLFETAKALEKAISEALEELDAAQACFVNFHGHVDFEALWSETEGLATSLRTWRQREADGLARI